MSKAILVMDMPKSCFDCKLQDWANCRIVKGCHVGSTRPDWCPLKEVPKKKELYLSINNKKGYCEGYNACIDEIVGVAEELKAGGIDEN